MNAQLLGFFSGFPTHHFPAEIVERLREDWGIKYWSKTPEFLQYVKEHS